MPTVPEEEAEFKTTKGRAEQRRITLSRASVSVLLAPRVGPMQPNIGPTPFRQIEWAASLSNEVERLGVLIKNMPGSCTSQEHLERCDNSRRISQGSSAVTAVTRVRRWAGKTQENTDVT